jgi:hypothetical protein
MSIQVFLLKIAKIIALKNGRSRHLLKLNIRHLSLNLEADVTNT